jgi:hypothetical protein
MQINKIGRSIEPLTPGPSGLARPWSGPAAPPGFHPAAPDGQGRNHTQAGRGEIRYLGDVTPYLIVKLHKQAKTYSRSSSETLAFNGLICDSTRVTVVN